MFGYYHLRLRPEERHTYPGMAASSKDAEYLAIAKATKVEDHIAQSVAVGGIQIKRIQAVYISSPKLIASCDGPYGRLVAATDDKQILF